MCAACPGACLDICSGVESGFYCRAGCLDCSEDYCWVYAWMFVVGFKVVFIVGLDAWIVVRIIAGACLYCSGSRMLLWGVCQDYVGDEVGGIVG